MCSILYTRGNSLKISITYEIHFDINFSKYGMFDIKLWKSDWTESFNILAVYFYMVTQADFVKSRDYFGNRPICL